MNFDSKIYIAGHKGMVGTAVLKKMIALGYRNLILRTHQELDLLNQKKVQSFFRTEKLDYVIIAAAKVGGINANNNFRGQFLYENLEIQNNIIHNAHLMKVKKLLFLGSACIYPKSCAQPIKEEYLLTNILEPTNEPYAIAKIAGIKLCENYYHQYGDNFISVMPNNLYGENDNYDLNNSHVLPALMSKIHKAKINNYKSVEIWGTGKPKREFLHVSDLADACVFIMRNLDASELYSNRISHINIGSGQEITIHDLAILLTKVIGYNGGITFNKDMPDGMERKLLDCSRMRSLGWGPKIFLEEGLNNTYKWYLSQLDS